MGAPNTIPSEFENFSVVVQPPPPPASSPNSTLREKGMMYLPEGYIPGPHDVICQRGKDCHEHVGNRRFRVCVENFVDTYVNSKTRQEKSAVISNIVKMINENDKNKQGGFIMKDPKAQRWHHVDIKVARDKVGNALRDAIKQRQDAKSSRTESMNNMFLNQPHRDSIMSWIKGSSSPVTDFFDDSTGGGAITTAASIGGGMDDPMTCQVQPQLPLSASQPADALFRLQQLKELNTVEHPSEILSDYNFLNQTMVCSHHHQSSSTLQLPLDQSFFSLTPTIDPQISSNSLHNVLGNGTTYNLPPTLLPFDALMDSMDIDDFDDFEPRPIGSMFG